MPHAKPFLPVRDCPAQALMTAAAKSTGMSNRSIAAVIEVDERTMRRWVDDPSGRDMPGPVRILVALIAAQPQMVPTLERLRDGLPLDDDVVTTQEFDAAVTEYGRQCTAWARNESADARALFAANQKLVTLFSLALVRSNKGA